MKWRCACEMAIGDARVMSRRSFRRLGRFGTSETLRAASLNCEEHELPLLELLHGTGFGVSTPPSETQMNRRVA